MKISRRGLLFAPLAMAFPNVAGGAVERSIAVDHEGAATYTAVKTGIEEPVWGGAHYCLARFPANGVFHRVIANPYQAGVSITRSGKDLI